MTGKWLLFKCFPVMKNFTFLLFTFLLSSFNFGLNAQDFITTWDLSKSPGSGENEIQFFVKTQGVVNYTWQEIGGQNSSGSGSFNIQNDLLSISFGNVNANSTIQLSISSSNLLRFYTFNGQELTPDASRLISVVDWGAVNWESFSNAFYACQNLVSVDQNSPNPTNDYSAMFFGAKRLNENLSAWNMSQATVLDSMFFGAEQFNGNVSAWNLGLVESMQSMFQNAYAFNQNLSTWNIASLDNASYMFQNADGFNGDVSTWNVSSVLDMTAMFRNADSFNQSLGNWVFNSNVKLDNFLDYSGLDCANYANSIQSWAGGFSQPNNLKMGVAAIEYASSAILARSILLSTKSWDFVGDSPSTITCGTINFPCLFNADAGANQTVCEGEDVTFQGTVSGIALYTSKWLTPDNETVNGNTLSVTNTTPEKTGVYRFIVSSVSCIDTAFIELKIHDDPELTAFYNKGVIEGQNLNLQALPNGFASYSWSGPNAFNSSVQNPIISNIQIVDGGTYTLSGTDANGCDYSSQVEVTINPCLETDSSFNVVLCSAYTSPSGKVFTETGNYTDTLVNANGCDSVLYINFTNNQPQKPSLFSNSPVIVEDSIIVWAQDLESQVSWEGPSGYLGNKDSVIIPISTYSDSGYYVVQSTKASCSISDSIFVSVVEPPCYPNDINLIVSVCDEYLSPKGILLTQSGNYSDTLLNVGGCDSVIFIDLTIKKGDVIRANSNSPLYVGDEILLASAPETMVNYNWSGPLGFSDNTQNASRLNAQLNHTGWYFVEGVSNNSCSTKDSIYLDVSEKPCFNSTVNLSLSRCGTYTSPKGVVYTSSASFTEVIPTVSGCDSIININLTILPFPTVNLTSNSLVNVGDSLRLYASSGFSNYYWTGPNGFKSAYQNPVISDAQIINAGYYNLEFTDNNGCQNLERVKVNVSNDNCSPSFANINKTVCDSYTSPSGKIFTNSNANIVDTIINSFGCDSIISINLTVNKSTEIQASVSNPVYVGDEANFSVSPSNAGFYAWSGPSGFNSTGSDVSFSNATVNKSGTYNVQLINNNNCVSRTSVYLSVRESGCINTFNNFSVVSCDEYVSPSGKTYTASGSYREIIPNSNGCDSIIDFDLIIKKADPVFLTSNSPVNFLRTIEVNASGAESYSWAGPNGFTSASNDFTITNADLSNNGFYVLNYESNSCSGVDTLFVEVKEPKCKPTVSGQLEFCELDSLGLIVSVDSFPNADVTWKLPNGTTRNGKDLIISSLSQAENGVFEVFIDAANGRCLDSTIVEVVVHELPVFDLGPDKILCQDSYKINGPSGDLDYDWSTGAISRNLTRYVNTADTYTLKVTDANGCEYQDSVFVQLFSTPRFTLAQEVYETCVGNDITVLGPDTNITLAFNWSKNNQTVFTGKDFTTNVPGVYVLQVTDSNNCRATDNAELIFNANPVAVATTSSYSCTERSVALNGQGGVSYEWSSDNGNQSNKKRYVITNIQHADSGWYQLVVTNEKLCTDTTEVFLEVRQTPDAPVVVDDTICQTWQATLVADGVGQTRWYKQGNNGVIFSGDTFTTPVLYDTTYYEATVTNNGCQSDRSLVVAKVNIMPDAPITELIDVCFGDSVLMIVQGGDGFFSWYDSLDTDNKLYEGDTLLIDEIFADTNFYVEEQLLFCIGERSNYPVTVSIPPVLKINNDTTICEDEVITLVADISDNNIGYWITSGDGTFTHINAKEAVYTPGLQDRDNGTVEIVYRIIDPDGPRPCGDITDTMQLDFYPQPEVEIHSVDLFCSVDSLLLDVSIDTLYKNLLWESSMAIGTFNDTSAEQTAYHPGVILQDTSAEITVTVRSLYGCKDIVTKKVHNILVTPTADFSLETDTACANTGVLVNYLGTGDETDTYYYKTPNGVASMLPLTNLPFEFSFSDVGTNKVSLVVANEYCSSEVFLNEIYVLPAPDASTLIASKIEVCEEEKVKIQHATATVGDVRYEISSDGIVFNPFTPVNDSVYIPQTKYMYAIASERGICKEDTSNLVTVQAIPEPSVGLITQSSDNVCPLDSVRLAVQSVVGDIVWQKSTDGLQFIDLVKQDSTVFDVFADSTAFFRAKVSTKCGVTYSNVRKLNVIQSAGVGQLNFANNLICGGDSVELSLSDFSADSLVWKIGSQSENITAAVFNVSEVKLPLTDSLFVRVLALSNNCNSDSTEIIKFESINALFAGDLVANTNEFCGVADYVLEAKNAVGQVKFQLTRDTLQLANEVLANNKVLETDTLSGVTYIRSIAFGSSCASDTSNWITVRVKEELSAGQVFAENNFVCEGSSQIIQVQGHQRPIINWYKTSADGKDTLDLNNSNNFLAVLNEYSTEYMVVLGTNSPYCPNDTISALVEVAPFNELDSIFSLIDPVCYGEKAFIRVVGVNANSEVYKKSVSESAYSLFASKMEEEYLLEDLPLENTTYKLVVDNGFCPAISDSVLVTVKPIVNYQLSASDTLICKGESVEISAESFADVQHFEVSYNGGPYGFAGDGSTGKVTINSVPTNILVRAIIDEYPCGFDTAYQYVEVVRKPAYAEWKDTLSVFCPGSDISLELEKVEATNISWWVSTDNGASFVEDTIYRNAEEYEYSNLSQDLIVKAYLEQYDCSDFTLYDTILVKPATQIGELIHNPESFCESSLVSVYFDQKIGGIISWESSEDGIAFSSLNSFADTVELLVPDSLLIVAQVQSNDCEVLTDSLWLRAFENTQAGELVAQDSAPCYGTTTELSIQNEIGEVVKWQWREKDDVFVDINESNKSITTEAIKDTLYYRAEIQNGPCALVFTNEIMLHPASQPAFLTAATNTICLGDSVLIDAENFDGNTVWESSSDKINWEQLGVNTSVIKVAPNMATYYRASQSPMGCATIWSDTLIIKVDEASNANSEQTLVDTLCEGSEIRFLVENKIGEITAWEIDNGSGVYDSVSVSKNHQDLSNLKSGLNKSRVTLKNGVCPSIQLIDSVFVETKNQPGNITASEEVICSNSSVLLSVSGYVGQNLRWVKSENEIDFVSFAGNQANISSGNLAKSTTFRAIISNATCEEVYSEKRIVVATSNNLVLDTVTNNLCEKEIGYARLESADGDINWAILNNDGDTVKSQLGGASIAYSLVTGNYVLHVSSRTDFCSPQKKAVEIIVHGKPLALNLMASQDSVCEGAELLLSGDFNSNNNWYWLRSENGVEEKLDSNQNEITVVANSAASQFIVAFDSRAYCPATRQTIDLKIYQSSDAGVLEPNKMAYCEGDTLELAHQGGIYTEKSWYELANGLQTEIESINNVFTTPLNGGERRFVVEAKNGVCPVQTTQYIVTPSEPTDLRAITANETALCQGDTLVLKTSGLKGKVLSWKARVINSNNVSVISQNLDSLVVVPMHTAVYQVEVQNGTCAVLSDSIVVNVGLNFEVDVPQDICLSDSLIKFDINVEGNYLASMNLPNGKDSLFELTSNNNYSFKVNEPGNYNLHYVRDLCRVDFSETVTVFNLPNYEITSKEDLICFGDVDGSISAAELGNFGSISFEWRKIPENILIGTGNSVTDLVAGTYQLMAYNDQLKSCASYETIQIIQPNKLDFTDFEIAQPICFNAKEGEVLARVKGGVAPYNFAWQSNFEEMNAENYQDLALATSQAFNLYNERVGLLVTDANGCELDTLVKIVDRKEILFNERVKLPTCTDDTDANIFVYPTGGEGEFEISWNDLSDVNNQLFKRTNLSSGSYVATLVDELGCEITKNIEIINPNPWELKMDEITPTCIGISTGEVSVVTVPRIENYTAIWSNGNEGLTASNLPKGGVVVTVEDSLGCEKKLAFAIGERAKPEIEIEKLEVECGSANAYFVAKSSYGELSANSKYSWANAFNLQNDTFKVNSTDLRATTVLISASDKGCENSKSLRIDYKVQPTASFSVDKSENFVGPSYKFINESKYADSYLWTFGETGNISIDENPETVTFSYSDDLTPTVCLEASNDNGCYTEFCVDLKLRSAADSVFIPSVFTPNGDGVNEEFLPILSGIVPQNYSLSIFNRWGQVLFETNNPNQGWNGEVNGELSREEAYMYLLEFTNRLTGESIKETGVVNLSK